MNKNNNENDFDVTGAHKSDSDNKSRNVNQINCVNTFKNDSHDKKNEIYFNVTF